MTHYTVSHSYLIHTHLLITVLLSSSMRLNSYNIHLAQGEMSFLMVFVLCYTILSYPYISRNYFKSKSHVTTKSCYTCKEMNITVHVYDFSELGFFIVANCSVTKTVDSTPMQGDNKLSFVEEWLIDWLSINIQNHTRIHRSGQLNIQNRNILYNTNGRWIIKWTW